MIVIVKSNGTQVGPMAQPQAESYLANVLSNPSLLPNLKQVLNDLTSGKGKASQPHTFNGQAVLHASSGNGAHSVSVFFYRLGGNAHLIAMGEHSGKVKGKESYKLTHYGQDANPNFKKGATLILS